MAQTESSQTETVTRNIQLENLLAPEHDVRQNRPDEEVDRIVNSIEQSGQIHAAHVHPEQPEEISSEDWDELDLQERMDECNYYRIVDGYTRYLAIERLGWATMRCEIHRDRPDNQEIISLEANTARIDMTDYETVRTLLELKERKGLTYEDLAEYTPISASRLRDYARLMKEPDELLQAWSNPNSHWTASHLAELAQLPDKEEKMRLAQMIEEHEMPVSQLKETVKNRLKTLQREAQSGSQRGADRRKGMAEADPQNDPNKEPVGSSMPPCVITGDDAYTTIEIPVSEEVYGLLQRLQQTKDPLLDVVRDDREASEEAQDVSEGWA